MLSKRFVVAMLVLMMSLTFINIVKAEPNNWSNWSKAAINWGLASQKKNWDLWCLAHVCACYRLPDSFELADNKGQSNFYNALECQSYLDSNGRLKDKYHNGWKNAPSGSMIFCKTTNSNGHVVLYLGNDEYLETIGSEVLKKKFSSKYGNNQYDSKNSYIGWAYPVEEKWKRPSDDTINKWANSGGSETITINVCSIDKAEYGGYEVYKGVSIAQKLRDELNKGSFTLTNYNDFFGVDPNPDNKKTLKLWFNNGSSSEYKEFQENQSVQFNKVSCGGGGGGSDC
ncbi:C40 family peptidase [bacterium]|nr:C40 family peptidase [bacterium]